ncbi:hypothetical protein OH76DRAFT_1302296, partial [Lentinus brumalis]
NLTKVIPAMDHLDDQLAKICFDKKIAAPVRSAAALGRKTCNRFYVKTDDTEIYRFAMAFHPECKLDYFKDADWEEEWIRDARALLYAEYERKYARYPLP